MPPLLYWSVFWHASECTLIDLVRECVIIKKGGGHVISGILGGLKTARRQENPKSSNSFPFIFDFLSFRAL